MSCIVGNSTSICGNFAKLSKKKPKNYDKDYKCFVKYPFKWRAKLGKVKCTCKICEEHFQPYYGWIWYHSEACDIMEHVKKYPQIKNLIARDVSIITYSD